MAKLLIDECLHTSLLELAHAAGHHADHVNYLGLGSSKDWELMDLVLERDYTVYTVFFRPGLPVWPLRVAGASMRRIAPGTAF